MRKLQIDSHLNKEGMRYWIAWDQDEVFWGSTSWHRLIESLAILANVGGIPAFRESPHG